MMFFIVTPIVMLLMTVLFVYYMPWWDLKHYRNRQKFKMFLSASFVLSVIVSLVVHRLSIDKMYSREIWSFKIESITHEEKWSTHETRTIIETHGSGKKQYTTTRVEHYTSYHGPYWYAVSEYGDAYNIDMSTYEKWKKTWNNEKHVGTHNGSSAGFDKPITGKIYKCVWDNKFENVYPVSDIHTYINKIRCTNNVFKYPEPTKQLLKKYPRPAENNDTRPVIAYGVKVSEKDMLIMRQTNAVLGPLNQIHVIMLLFDKTYDRSVVSDILSAWQGVNKNEMVIFIGMKNNQVNWCETVSWMDNTKYHNMINDFIIGVPLNFIKLSEFLRKTVYSNWKRKEFKDFDYLKVSIDFKWYVIGIVVEILLQIIIAFGVHKICENKYD